MSVKAMIKKSILESDMYNQSISLSTLITILVDMAIALVIGLLIYEIYKKFYEGVVYSRTFALTLVGMTVLTCMVTLAISTNIVISLGMVGALSIVRYRTAVKEPLDIMYLFWAITMGITIGASMYLLAAVGMLMMLVLVAAMHKKQEKAGAYVLILHCSSEGEKLALEKLSDVSHAVKSCILRGETEELTVTVDLPEKKLGIVDELKKLSGVEDVTLVRYNGEYHS
ncbi:Uncharacterized membrane protein YhiD, involved in acid resistance [Lachnospiraceae bacterium]|nr:Uncharacterized membrane protein YhiD, involved in acid resistance [Lachnospiraceae bacterium]